MNEYRVENVSKKIVIAKNVMLADCILSRMKGLMFQSNLEVNQGLWIDPCKSIHTFFMQFPIDTIFLSKDLKVVHKIENLIPWNITGYYFKAQSVLELKAGTIQKKISLGDQLEFICIN